jgi:hypothetical protein
METLTVEKAEPKVMTDLVARLRQADENERTHALASYQQICQRAAEYKSEPSDEDAMRTALRVLALGYGDLEGDVLAIRKTTAGRKRIPTPEQKAELDTACRTAQAEGKRIVDAYNATLRPPDMPVSLGDLRSTEADRAKGAILMAVNRQRKAEVAEHESNQEIAKLKISHPRVADLLG